MNSPLPYLVDLTLRLGAGVGELDTATRNHHAAYFLAAQQPDGGFAGRDGPSDLYYTAFGVRSLALLARLEGETAERVAGFLRSRLDGHAHIIDFFSLVFATQLLDSAAGIDVLGEGNTDWQQQVGAAIESLRAPDGGYAKSHEGVASSTYYSFLATLTRQLAEQPINEPDKLAEFVLSQRRDDGGFVEIRPMRRSGTNPTAAAVGLLRVLDGQPSKEQPSKEQPRATRRIDADLRDNVADFLLDLQTDEGGLRANTQIPVADLLSTFTGLLTLVDLGCADELEIDAMRRFVASVRQPEGGFYAANWDGVMDVEYSFYGLAASALLAML